MVTHFQTKMQYKSGIISNFGNKLSLYLNIFFFNLIGRCRRGSFDLFVSESADVHMQRYNQMMNEWRAIARQRLINWYSFVWRLWIERLNQITDTLELVIGSNGSDIGISISISGTTSNANSAVKAKVKIGIPIAMMCAMCSWPLVGSTTVNNINFPFSSRFIVSSILHAAIFLSSSIQLWSVGDAIFGFLFPSLCFVSIFFSCFAYLSGKYDFWLMAGWRLGETNTRVRLDFETLERERMMYLSCVCMCSHIWGLLTGRRTMQIIFIRAFDMKRPQAINWFIVGFISFDFTCQTVSFQIPDLKLPIECTIEKCSWFKQINSKDDYKPPQWFIYDILCVDSAIPRVSLFKCYDSI